VWKSRHYRYRLHPGGCGNLRGKGIIKMKLRIINLKNGLSKTIDAPSYTMEDLEKTYLTYEGREKFIVKIIR
jgi:hypothetical protein